MEQVGQWAPNTVHVQDFPQEFLTFVNNYMAQTNMQQQNQNLQAQFNSLILGDDLAPGPMAAVGYQGSDPVGTAASATNDTQAFYVAQICAAADQRGMGPIVDQSSNSMTVAQSADTFEAALQAANQYDAALAAVVQQAGKTDAQYASNWSTQNANSDAAILAMACAMVESTPALLMEANPADPPTMTFFYNSLRTTGTGSGLFNQANDGNWGTPGQRMNPLASAGMFLDKLNAQTGWRNMQGGQAIWQVQQSDPATIALYNAAIQPATKIVQAYRTSAGTAASSASSILGQVPGLSNVTNVLGGGNNPISSAAGLVGQAATSSPLSTAAAAANAGGPNPNSEGAINAAMSIVGTPYQYGGTTPGVGIDCSALVMLSFGAIGESVTRTTGSQKGVIPPVPLSSIQRGDVLQTEYGGHTGIYLGGGQWIQTGGPNGVPGHIEPVPTGPSGLCWAGRVCQNGGINPAAPFTPVTGASPATGLVPGTGVPIGAGSGGVGSAGGASGSEPIARNLFSYQFQPAAYATAASYYFTGQKAYIDDIPLIQTVRALAMASLRNFQSAPNGDFIAYYPDPFGMDGKPAILALEDIELKDCHMDLSDNNMATHVYIEGDYTMMGQADAVNGWIGTCGYATVENPWLFQRLISTAPGDFGQNMSAGQLMKTYGVRPYKDTYQLAGNAGMEFLLACQIFMGKWASQYETDVGLTFMPELFPGMRILLVGHNLTVYASQVTHEFDWERGFRTTASISAPSNPQGASAIYQSSPGFLNPVSTTPGSNAQTTGQRVTQSFQAPLVGGPLFSPAGTFPGSDAVPGTGLPGSQI
jgi:cell wall-associated NlpC family hydrolase